MADFTDLVLDTWKEALRRGGDGEGATSILATSLAFAAADAGMDIDAVLSRVRDDHATALVARNSTAT